MKFDKSHVDTQRIFSFFRTQRWKNHIFWTIFASSSIRMKNVNAEIVETSRDAQATGNYWIIADWSCKTSSFWNIRTRKEKKFHGFFFLNKNIYEIISIYMYKYIPRLWSWSGEESSVIQPVLGWLLLNLKAPVFSELFKEDSSSSQSVLLEENTKSRLGNLSIHSTLETGTHENLKVELCMWKYTMTSTGNEVEVVATACPAWDPELESSKLSSLVLVA